MTIFFRMRDPHAGVDPDRLPGRRRRLDAALLSAEGDLMSKAFVKETDDEAGPPDEPPATPAGVKNYMTPQGHRRMQDELRQLLRVERPKVVETVAWAAGNGDRSENGDYIYGKRRLREVDRRIRFLSKRSRRKRPGPAFSAGSGRPLRPAPAVTYANERGTEMTVTIVGIDEADLDRGQVSWLATSSSFAHRRGSSRSRCWPSAMAPVDSKAC